MTVSQASDPETVGPAKSGALHEVIEIVKTIAWALGIALVLRVLLFQPFTIPSASMEPALYEGDYIVVTKWNYGYSRHSIPFSPKLFDGRIAGRAPTRGDIAVFKLPRDGHTDYIKRIVGLPGDRVQMRGGVLYLNGKAVPRTDVTGRSEAAQVAGVRWFDETLPNGKVHRTQELGPSQADDTRVYTVPAGCLMMIGDNRDNSIDGRFAPTYMPDSANAATGCRWEFESALPFEMEQQGVGFVPVENLVGKAEIILLSWTADVELFLPWTWVTELRPSRFFKRLH